LDLHKLAVEEESNGGKDSLSDSHKWGGYYQKIPRAGSLKGNRKISEYEPPRTGREEVRGRISGGFIEGNNPHQKFSKEGTLNEKRGKLGTNALDEKSKTDSFLAKEKKPRFEPRGWGGEKKNLRQRPQSKSELKTTSRTAKKSEL